MKKTARLILTLFLCAFARAGWCANVVGTGAAPFLKLPVDARTVGMGEAGAAVPRGAMALFQNPGGLAANGSAAFAFSHSLLVEDISYDVLGAAVPLRLGVIGVGAQYLRYGSFQSLDNTGAAAGSLAPRDSAYTAGYGLSLDDDIYVGGSAKYISSKISGSASTTAMDLGAMITGDDFSVGFAMQNLGKGLKFNKEYAPLATNVKFGMIIPCRSWLIAADFNFPKDGPAWLAAGTEYTYKLKFATVLGRVGYNTSATDTKGVNGVSAGFGLMLKSLSLDYGFKTMGMLGSTHHFGLTYHLGN